MKRNSALSAVTIVFSSAALVVFFSSLLPAQSGARQTWWTSDEVHQKLDLTDEQVVQIGILQQAHQERFSSVLQAERRAFRELITALDDASRPPELIAEKRKQLEEAWSSHLQASVDNWFSLRQALTAEQWQALPNVAPRVFRMGRLNLRARSPAKNPVGNG